MPEGTYLMGNAKYAEAIWKELGLTDAKPAVTPINTKLLESDLEDMLEPLEATSFRGCVGMARFLVVFATET